MVLGQQQKLVFNLPWLYSQAEMFKLEIHLLSKFSMIRLSCKSDWRRELLVYLLLLDSDCFSQRKLHKSQNWMAHVVDFLEWLKLEIIDLCKFQSLISHTGLKFGLVNPLSSSSNAIPPFPGSFHYHHQCGRFMLMILSGN